MKKVLSLIICMVMCFCIAACTKETTTPQSHNQKLKIVATIFPQYDFARQIAGDKAEVTMLITPGTESHSFEPTTSDIMDINDCDIFIYTGGESDHWIDDLLKNTDNNTMKTIPLMDYIDVHAENEDHEHSHHNHSHVDEHIWTSPKNAMVLAKNICNHMCSADPDNAEYYIQNLNAYLSQLQSLDESFAEITVSAKRNTLIFGDRFPLKYFADEYGLDCYAAFSGCSEDTEASAATVARLTDKAREESIPVILKIELSSSLIADTIAKETAAEVMTFYSCHNISKEDFENGETYLSLMQKNVNTLSVALN